jgi:hypothetical protein
MVDHVIACLCHSESFISIWQCRTDAQSMKVRRLRKGSSSLMAKSSEVNTTKPILSAHAYRNKSQALSREGIQTRQAPAYSIPCCLLVPCFMAL